MQKMKNTKIVQFTIVLAGYSVVLFYKFWILFGLISEVMEIVLLCISEGICKRGIAFTSSPPSAVYMR